MWRRPSRHILRCSFLYDPCISRMWQLYFETTGIICDYTYILYPSIQLIYNCTIPLGGPYICPHQLFHKNQLRWPWWSGGCATMIAQQQRDIWVLPIHQWFPDWTKGSYLCQAFRRILSFELAKSIKTVLVRPATKALAFWSKQRHFTPT